MAMVGGAFAAQPVDWGTGFQPAVTDVMRDIAWFEDMTFWIMAIVVAFVLLLQVIVYFKFRESANATPSKTSHHTMLEVAWTVVPILILVAISIPSFRLLNKQLILPPAELTVKVTGYQWYWGYQYPDNGDFEFEALLLTEDEAAEEKKPYLLATDYDMVVPVNKVVRVQVTAADVIHAFAMPAFGVKIDAIPGRLNETWFKAEKEGVYYGQCSELCGKDHAYMPITVRVVSDEQFEQWTKAAADDIDEAKELLASFDAEHEALVKVAQQ
ncbi:cytochrome c oxidase subunit II [Coralliovum pocilloporae]|uniref:cytochrome c oxidase subunit II n=1 Tax=Coralliovum pocilloporae TaxID=3066369 RepID=UPI003D9C41F0